MWHFCNFTQPDGTHHMPCLINLTSWACALPLSLSSFFFPLQTHSSHLLSSPDLPKSIIHRHMSITCHLYRPITHCHHEHHSIIGPPTAKGSFTVSNHCGFQLSSSAHRGPCFGFPL